MALSGIDISDYQRGLDLSRVPCDFVICKATEGGSLVHQNCDPWIQQAQALGKLWGFYHFMNGEDPIVQATHFLTSCTGYFGHGIPVLDYEMYGRIGTPAAKKFLDRVYEVTGVRCVVYMSRSVCAEEDWSQIAPHHALWVAQYASNERTGYQEHPWLSAGRFGAWDHCALHQYSSNGRLEGYDGPLDLDIAYLTREAWGRIAAPSGVVSSPLPAPQPPQSAAQTVSVLELAARVMAGEYGNGEQRRHALAERYDEVQTLINYIRQASNEQLAGDVERGRFGNGAMRQRVLGARYEAVQALVNERARR